MTAKMALHDHAAARAAQAEAMTAAVEQRIQEISNILVDASVKNFAVDFSKLKSKVKNIAFDAAGLDVPALRPEESTFLPKQLSFLQRLIPAIVRKHEQAIADGKASYDQSIKNYEEDEQRRVQSLAKAQADHEARVEAARQRVAATNASMDSNEADYRAHVPEAVVEYFSMVFEDDAIEDRSPASSNGVSWHAIAASVVPVCAGAFGMADRRRRRGRRKFYGALGWATTRALALRRCTRRAPHDSLSAAFKNLPDRERREWTSRYAALCAHYGMRPSRNNPGESHENGSIESRNGSLKTALRQALLLRSSSDFDDRPAYEAFIEIIVQRMNARAEKRLVVERAALRPLPARRTVEFDELAARVSKYGIFTVKGEQYGAPSQLVGHRLSVRGSSCKCKSALDHLWQSQQPGGANRPRVDGYKPCARLVALYRW